MGDSTMADKSPKTIGTINFKGGAGKTTIFGHWFMRALPIILKGAADTRRYPAGSEPCAFDSSPCAV
jgi:hypothetical protein